MNVEVLRTVEPYLFHGLAVVGMADAQIMELAVTLHRSPDSGPSKQALDDYGWLLQEGMRGIELNERKAMALVEAMRGWWVGSPHEALGLACQVESLLHPAHGDCAILGFSAAESAAFVAELESMNSLQLLVLMRLAKQVHSTARTSADALIAIRAVGLVREAGEEDAAW